MLAMSNRQAVCALAAVFLIVGLLYMPLLAIVAGVVLLFLLLTSDWKAAEQRLAARRERR
jgi:hypothetical protein